MLDLYDEFKAIIATLNQCEIDYAVCGGLAMAVYGLARATGFPYTACLDVDGALCLLKRND
jgi:hypothetical protein